MVNSSSERYTFYNPTETSCEKYNSKASGWKGLPYFKNNLPTSVNAIYYPYI